MNHDQVRDAAAEAACGPSEPVPYTYSIWSFGRPKPDSELTTHGAYMRHHRGRCEADCRYCRPRRRRSWRNDYTAHLANPDWQDDAACRDGDPELFFPELGENGVAAKAVCAGCPVRTECLHHAIYYNEKHGVWGGTVPRDRDRIRRRERAS